MGSGDRNNQTNTYKILASSENLRLFLCSRFELNEVIIFQEFHGLKFSRSKQYFIIYCQKSQKSLFMLLVHELI